MMWKKTFLLAAFASVTLCDSITDCHAHGSVYYCVNTDGVEASISPAPTGNLKPSSYTSCHNHGSETYCMNGDDEVRFMVETTAEKSSASITSMSAQTTAVTGCHLHGATQFCLDGKGNEGYMSPVPTNTKSAPVSYTGCHAHATETYCLNADGEEVKFVVEETVEAASGLDDDGEMDCHFHAGVEHCIKKGQPESGGEAKSCARVDRDYNVPVRIGTLFAVLATSAIGVFLPLIVKKVMNTTLDGTIVMFFKQFGTGVILSTALVHLTTHAQLMFANDCLTLHYESTSTAITMAGLFLGFLSEFVTTRILVARRRKLDAATGFKSSEEEEDKDSEVKQLVHSHTHSHGSPVISDDNQDKISVMMLEAGIVFHSVLVGLTTVVAGDSYYITLFIVILFHQAFEGVALGSRIAELRNVSVWIKIIMGLGFAITTPLGMAIGIGALNYFNGNDPSTVIAIGTLDALSAGVLLWVGIIEMLAHDWLYGTLAEAGVIKIIIALIGLVGGMVLMSFLGKWT